MKFVNDLLKARVVSRMSKREVEIEIGKNTEGFWFVSADGLVHAQSRFEVIVRDIAVKVQELNPDVDFRVVG